MNPIRFKEQTKVLARPSSMSKDECGSLPVFFDEKDKACISCWKMSLKERLRALISGKVWIWVFSGQTQPPIAVGCYKTVFEKPEKK